MALALSSDSRLPTRANMRTNFQPIAASPGSVRAAKVGIGDAGEQLFGRLTSYCGPMT